MLQGRQPVDTGALERGAQEVEQDPVVLQTFGHSEASDLAEVRPGVSRSELEEALKTLKGEYGPKVVRKQGHSYQLSGISKKAVTVGLNPSALEGDVKILPFTPSGPLPTQIADVLERPGERLPLVVGSSQDGNFRSVVLLWVGSAGHQQVTTLAELKQQIDRWDSIAPSEEAWVKARSEAERVTRRRVAELRQQAKSADQRAMVQQLDAVRRRLLREVGRYLVCLDRTNPDLSEIFTEQLRRDRRAADRLRRCQDRLGGHPSWESAEQQELAAFAERLEERQRLSRITGGEVDAALADPRWGAVARQVHLPDPKPGEAARH